jgi:SAM-dependent methyltransferase
MSGVGGYDEGYRACPCFWGTEPGSLVVELERCIKDFRGLSVLDAGSGEGKNAGYLAGLGANVIAFDVSEVAVRRAKALWEHSSRVRWAVADVRAVVLAPASFDVVLAYGLFHCLENVEEIVDTIKKVKAATKAGGYNMICAFNDRFQDLSAHPGFQPVLLSHEAYRAAYRDWDLLVDSDTDLTEVHPHNAILHTHALTRILARRDERSCRA